MDAGFFNSVKNELLSEAEKTTGAVTKIFDATDECGRIMRTTLEDLRDEGLILISRQAVGMITYTLTESGKELVRYI